MLVKRRKRFLFVSFPKMFVLFAYECFEIMKKKKIIIRKSGTVQHIPSSTNNVRECIKKNDCYYDIRNGYLVKFNDSFIVVRLTYYWLINKCDYRNVSALLWVFRRSCIK